MKGIKMPGIRVRLKNGSEDHIDYVYTPDVKTIILVVTTCVAVITGCVLAGTRLRQVPINTRRLDCIEKQVVKMCARQAATQVLNEALVKKMYGNEAGTVIIQQSKDMEASIEQEMNKFINPKEVR
jgi:hypothetical protein